MSAILGRIEFDGRPVDAALFARAFGALAPYGPDGGGSVVGGDTGLGRRHLEVARRQAQDGAPLTEGALTLVADAILDDREGLGRALGLAPAEVGALSDGALILRAWQRWGEDCPRHLAGDFAFALWDGARRRLFLARDHIGARPLYWARRGESLLFATDVRALTAFADLDWRIDEAMVARYMTDADRPLPKGLFEAVHTVVPGHRMTVTAGGQTAVRWWDPRAVPLDRGLDTETAVLRLRALVEEAVACRTDTYHPVGSHLSGGIDSTSVTVIAQRALQRRGSGLAAAYCWAPEVSAAHPDMGKGDERRRVAALAAAEGFAVRHGGADGATFMAFLARPIEFEGTADLLDEIPILDRAAEDGVRVMLSGWGGDEVVSSGGLGYLAGLLRRGRLIAAFRALRATSGGRRNPRVLGRLLWSRGIVPLLPGPLFERLSPFVRIYRRRSFMSRDFAARFPARGALYPPDVRPVPDPRRYMAAMLLRGHLALRMESWAAWGAEKGLLYRYPLLDRRVLEFMLSLPPEVAFARGEGRYLFRTAMAPYFGGPTNKRDPANERMRSQSRLECWQALAQALRDDEGGRHHDWLDLEALRRQVEAVPDTIGVPEILAFAEVCSAMRVRYLDRRQG
jgi:asparagine synthase (glutamine-hydrolysing)